MQRHIMIINPTKYLGNLLMSLGLIQEACSQFERSGQGYSLVFDESFRSLTQPLFKPEALIFYPRVLIRQSNLLMKIRLTHGVLGPLRRFKHSVAIDLEGDSVSSVLTVLSGATETIGPHSSSRSHWYKTVSVSKPDSQGSEFLKYRNVLSQVAELPYNRVMYGQLNLPRSSSELSAVLQANRVIDLHKLIVLHTGARQTKKCWPVEHWIELVSLLQVKGFKPVLIGAGYLDSNRNQKINASLETPVPDLSNQLSLTALSQLIAISRFYVGNDSGPMHLATALKVPGIALFGPTSDKIWGPLHPNMQTLRARQCPRSCQNGNRCKTNFSCLAELKPQVVLNRLLAHFSLNSSPTSDLTFTATEFLPTPANDQTDSAHSIDHSLLRSAAPWYPL